MLTSAVTFRHFGRHAGVFRDYGVHRGIPGRRHLQSEDSGLTTYVAARRPVSTRLRRTPGTLSPTTCCQSANGRLALQPRHRRAQFRILRPQDKTPPGTSHRGSARGDQVGAILFDKKPTTFSCLRQLRHRPGRMSVPTRRSPPTTRRVSACPGAGLGLSRRPRGEPTSRLI